MPTTLQPGASDTGRALKTIVVVDDEEGARMPIRAALRSLHCRILEAETGQGALAMVRAQHPDLLILGWMMPGMDGLEVARVLRSDPTTAALPILMVSAQGEEAQAQASEAGVTAYIGKPFTLPQLRQMVRKLLGEDG
jgi:two-component system phosphate regulon response regulator PhoB